ncbi:MBL fold metallo-hydrolase [Citreicella sp. C3M06]|uniref:MBL fold metallo-hydrolase n=1 Tax=Citreicella sp. C3M06 TaxID=2841564 RepID=UPI001C0803FA|nr:MBL fold metallo-hydrolase [Citreicella sp. C3M06]MBU2961251.1 MBL fold metallo-hydrolase [Citreicella sp. C3M06]
MAGLTAFSAPAPQSAAANARLTALSGMGRKSAAVFLLELEGRRLLLDLGDGLEAGERPDLSGAGRIDAVILSHAHEDHAGGLDRLPEIGSPPVFASAETLRQLGQRLPAAHALPEQGEAEVLGLPLLLGRSGHAPGGIWMRLPTRGGLLYTGDFSVEAPLLPCDPFPRAEVVIADASYGDRDEALRGQIDALASLCADGAILPCPPHGRGADMVTALSARGLSVKTCAEVADDCARLTGTRPDTVSPATASPRDIIIATGPNAERGLPAALRNTPGFRFVFSSHVPRSSPAWAMIDSGRAQWSGWNVHPRLRDILSLAEQTGARRILPAFVDLAQAPRLSQALGARLCQDSSLEV